MANKKMKMYWLLLLVLVFAASAVLSVGVSQARYVNVVTAPAVVKTPNMGVTSNCLISADDAARTVLLGELEYGESIMVPFWMLSTGMDEKQTLDWGVTNAKYADYLNISVFAGYEQLKVGKKLELMEDIRLDLILRLEPTKKAQTTPHETLRVNVHVTWGNELWGTFQVVLPAVAEPETEPVTEPPVEETTGVASEETTEPTMEPVTEETAETATEESVEPTTEPATEETTEDATEEPVEPTTEPAVEETTQAATEETAEPTTEPAAGETTQAATEETAEPTTEPVAGETTQAATEGAVEPVAEPVVEETTEAAEEAAEPTTEPAVVETTEVATEETTEEPTTEPATEPATEAEIEPVTEPEIDWDSVSVQMNLINLKALPSWAPGTGELPVVLELDENISSVRLGVQQEYGDLTVFEPFPDYTMFSLDGGASYYMLYGNHVPEFVVQNVTSVPLLLNFSYAEQDGMWHTVTEESKEWEELTLAMDAYTGDRMRKRCVANVLSAEESGEAVVKPQDQIQTMAEVSDQKFSGLVLTMDDRLEFSFPVEWEDAQLEYAVEFLTFTEEQELEYVPVTLTKEGLYATYHIDENTHKLVLRLGEKFAQPGTYRIKISWSYEEVCFTETQTTFFVNYSARMPEMEDGQEVPNDD